MSDAETDWMRGRKWQERDRGRFQVASELGTGGAGTGLFVADQVVGRPLGSLGQMMDGKALESWSESLLGGRTLGVTGWRLNF